MPPAGALPPVNPGLDLAAVVDHAYRRSPDLPRLQARLAAARALQGQSRSLLGGNPALFGRNENDELLDDDGRVEWEWGVELPLWWPGQRARLGEVASRAMSAAELERRAHRLSVAGVCRELLWTIALRRNALAQRRQEHAVSRKLLESVEARVRLGDLAEMDRLLAEQETLSRESAMVEARRALRDVLARYEEITGLSAVPAAFEEPATGDGAITPGHPLLAPLAAQTERAQAAVALRRMEARGHPSLTLGTRHERDVAGADYTDVIGLEVRVPLALASHVTRDVADAELDAATAATELAAARRRLQTDLARSRAAMASISEALDLARRKDTLARRHLELAQRAFALGETDLVTLLRLQSQAFEASRDARRLELELGRERARARQALGVLP